MALVLGFLAGRDGSNIYKKKERWGELPVF